MEVSKGPAAILQLSLLKSAIAQPFASFDRKDLYPTIGAKAAALGHSIICNHPFLDGNKRTGHAAMEVFLELNGFTINAGVDEQEQQILLVASGGLNREDFAEWLQLHIHSK